jgi:hypothetical protein
MAATRKPKAAVKQAVKAKPVKPKAVRRTDTVKAKIKAQVAGLESTHEARTTRVKAAVDAVKAKRVKRAGARSPSPGTKTRATLPVAVVKPKSTRARIESAVAAVKARIGKGRRVTSTEGREAALAIAETHAGARPRARTANDQGAPVNENASTSTSSARLATIAPRGVFLPDRVVVDVEGDTYPRTKLDEHGRDEAVLSGSTVAALKQQVAEAQRLVDGDAPSAFRAFRAALELLPAPVQNWNAAGWLLVAMGECAVRTGDFAAALAPLKDAMHCPGTVGNPWVHLLLGRCRLELGDERAADELARAYMGGGRALFEGLDPKYFTLVEQVLKPPPGHDRLP